MNQVPDRKKLRREYLRRIRDARLIQLLPICAAVAVGCVEVYLFVSLLFPPGIAPGPGRNAVLYGALSLLPFLAALIWSANAMIRVGKAEMAKLHYVAPVTTATFPAEEILVRGSAEPPVAQSEVLLRAVSGQETLKEELLRVAEE